VPACTAKTTTSCCGIPIFGGLAAIFGGLESAGLLYLMRFAGESPGYTSHKSGCPTSVHCCGMGAASNGIHLPKLPLIPPLPASRR
jgi:hypothetical protein